MRWIADQQALTNARGAVRATEFAPTCCWCRSPYSRSLGRQSLWSCHLPTDADTRHGCFGEYLNKIETLEDCPAWVSER